MIHHIIRSLSLYKEIDQYYQTGLIALWEASRSFNHEAGTAFSTYAYATIRGRLLTQLKKETEFAERHLANENQSILERTTITENPLSTMIIASYCEGLSESQTKWVMAHFIEQKKTSEIAQESGVSKETVKTWRKEALKRMRGRINRGTL